MSKEYRINVNVATVWTSPESVRAIDFPAITSPTDISQWLKALEYEPRAALSSENLVQTQALFGQTVLLLNETEEWAHIIVSDQPSSKDSRGYPGWVPKCQLTAKTSIEEPRELYAVVTSPLAILYDEQKNPDLLLSFQTRLQVIQETHSWIRVDTPNGVRLLRSSDVRISKEGSSRNGSGADIVAIGEVFLGLPYLWGGMTGFGFDCSGFAYTMCQANGYTIPRDAHDQAKSGQAVALDQLRPGDLLFFAYEEGKGRVHHVGIYYGEGQMIHAPNTGRSVEIITLEGTLYEKELCVARRYFS
ncbi:cell wall-associated NlpC family hydrolase [Pullulanibacillus pueri]|uniref:Gamma-D-glutamyl-L-lysine endopeptidase n=1 Tax=Pullulanibacillus pueri TaxID=1437324 RepID=A0A8J2ZS34_9BACL|nr:C40 family peptidase [Pullulanibacillus pueri]MBM7679981.1 cell wall-associated NlpC family hydrolase [Pullulanibacillus pueri]GGH73780.1 gamma-D-glutamyl-L-lysine endopeptidase [Pullulanibacillus pueri]